jgi:predicted GNAT family acetyltransferase
MQIMDYSDSYFSFIKENVSDKRVFTFWTGWELSYPINRDELNDIIERHKTKPIFAKINEEIIGYAEIGSKSEFEGYFTRFLIDKQKRNMGYGKLLLQNICNTLFYDNKKERILITAFQSKANNFAKKLYERIGFKIIGNENVDMNDFFPNEFWNKFEMALQLNNYGL